MHTFNKKFILNKNIKIVSFDIFDTVISRTVAEPKAVFDLLAYQISGWKSTLPRVLRSDFTKQRMRAERRARESSTKEDVTLHEIYNFLTDEFDLSLEIASKLKALEIKIELECILPVPKAIGYIDTARSVTKRIIFISDMYLPKAVIVRMLKQIGVFEKHDGVYISGEIGLTKSSGKLFHHVLGEENCSSSEMLHIGDHSLNDYKRPKRLGIHAVQLRDAHLNRYEKALLTGSAPRPSLNPRQSLAGASRNARLTIENNLQQTKADVHQLGTNIAGPILFLYALWIIRQAKSRKLRRLYFMARDGQIIMNVVQKILDKTRGTLELRYLYGSRQAWNLPSLINLTEDESKWLFHAEPYLTIRALSNRLNMAPELLMPYLSQSNFHVSDSDTPLTQTHVAELSQIVLNNESIKSLILEKADSARKALLTYLHQENLTHGLPFALVDTGWYATSQVRLKKILNISGHNADIIGLYFGLRSTPKNASQFSYFFDTGSPTIYKEWGKAFITIFEVLCSANHGMTTGYSLDINGIASPKLKESFNGAAVSWGLNYLRRGIDIFMESLPRQLYDIDPLDFRCNILEIVKLLISKPTLKEATLLGEFRFSSEQTERVLADLAPPLTLQLILSSLLDRSGVKRRNLTFWPEASILRSSFLIRTLIPLVFIRPFMRVFGNENQRIYPDRNSKYFTK